jgi:hypothetical protein
METKADAKSTVPVVTNRCHWMGCLWNPTQSGEVTDSFRKRHSWLLFRRRSYRTKLTQVSKIKLIQTEVFYFRSSSVKILISGWSFLFSELSKESGWPLLKECMLIKSIDCRNSFSCLKSIHPNCVLIPRTQPRRRFQFNLNLNYLRHLSFLFFSVSKVMVTQS